MKKSTVDEEQHKSDHLLVLPVGTKVHLGPDNDIEGIITAISIYGNNRVAYECVWWDGRQRRQGWVNSIELRDSEVVETQQIGFKS